MKNDRFEIALADAPGEIRNDIIEMDAYLRQLRPLKFKRSIDKTGNRIAYASPDFGISYAIRASDAQPSQDFGWYFLHDRQSKKWYRKTDYFEETLVEIAKTAPKSARRIFDAINECSSCKGDPCSAIAYEHEGRRRLACYGRIRLGINREDLGCARLFFEHLNDLLKNIARE
ncbi:MAG: hypothetical protein FWE09_02080 [Treponema sp.]|nr:hypothetical protein [Treponema sp.]